MSEPIDVHGDLGLKDLLAPSDRILDEIAHREGVPRDPAVHIADSEYEDALDREADAAEAGVAAAEPRPYRLYSAAELDELPPAEWIIGEAVPRRGIVAVIGAKGVLKTFFALDVACHVATGIKWHGRTVTPGPVVYVFAEGPFGAKARIDAWCEFNAERSGLPLNRGELPLWILPSRLSINDSNVVTALSNEIKRLAVAPTLIVIDTLNQNLDGDEDGKGMNAFGRGCAQLRDTFNATVLVVHHTPLGSDDRGRGHSAFDGIVDARFIITRDADRAVVDCTHQRNAADGWSVAYEAVPMAGSLALKPSGPTGGALKGQRRELLALVHSQGPLSFTAWHTASDLKRSTFSKARRWLSDNGYVREEHKKYSITAAGSIALGLPGSPEVHRD